MSKVRFCKGRDTLGDMSLQQVTPCVLRAKQVATTRRLLDAHAVIWYEGECELVF